VDLYRGSLFRRRVLIIFTEVYIFKDGKTKQEEGERKLLK